MSAAPLELDERMMDLALALGEGGRPAPNPHVGAVIARGEEVIATGFHPRRGEAHAELVALRDAGERARGATLYCTLEPCNHHGRTPPCTDAILAAGIARVVIGCLDPARHGVPGRARLEAAGVEVVVGVREPAAARLVEDFAKLVRCGSPFVVLKAAITLDGRMATRSGDSKWITGEAARREAHRLRARCDAVMVGVGTVLADDPRLDVRMGVEGVAPARVVLDRELRTPPGAQVLALARQGVARTWIVHREGADASRARALEAAGAELVAQEDASDLGAVLRALGAREVMRLLVEGGPRVHGALLDAGLADRAELFVAPLILGDPGAPGLATRLAPPARMADALRLEAVEHRALEGGDLWISGRFPR